jgi:hypothetical protein
VEKGTPAEFRRLLHRARASPIPKGASEIEGAAGAGERTPAGAVVWDAAAGVWRDMTGATVAPTAADATSPKAKAVL